MAGHVTSGSSSVVVGQTVNVQVSMDLAPSIPRETNADEMAVTSETFDVNTRQVIAVTGTTTAAASIELAQRMGAAGTFTQTIHPTQQLFTENRGSRFLVQVVDYVTYGADYSILEIEWGWDPALGGGSGGGFIRVWALGAQIGEYQSAGFIPMLGELKINYFANGSYSVYYGAVYLASGTFPTETLKPYKIKYVYYKVSGLPQSVTWPSGHPANGQGWSRWMFAEAALTGNWHVFEPTWTAIPLDASNVQIGATPVNPTAIDYVNNVPVASFVVPASAGIAKFRVRARYHYWNNSTLGWPYLDIPVGAGGSTPLVVNGPNPVTLEPGQTYTVTANYPTSELTFAAVGGGSFGTGATANVFTAPTDAVTAATCHFTVTRPASSESVNIGVIVPLRLTPGTFSMIGGATQVINSNADIATWSVTGGSLSGSAARSRTYTAPASVGSFTITAQTTGGALSANAIATVTSSGTAPTTELRLEPFAGYSVALNATPVVSMLGDTDPALWAKLSNMSIDGATGNLKVLSNAAFGEAFMAQCFDPSPLATASIFEWAFNSTQQQVPGDTGRYDFILYGGTESALGWCAQIVFSYRGTGDDWKWETAGGGANLTANFTWTATAGIRVESTFNVSGVCTLVWKFRASNAVGFSTIATMTFPTTGFQPRFLVANYEPTVSSRSNNTIVFAKPTIVSGFVRWYRPNWTASRVDGSGNVLGSYAVTPGEDNFYTSGQLAQTAAITCNAVGTARVSASYPSGVSAANNVFITIAASGTGLAVTAPAEGVITDLAPGGVLTVTANDSPTALTYSCPGGTFGSGASKNVFTAGPTAGYFTLTVSRGSEVVTRTIRVMMKVTPETSSLPLGGTAFLDINTSTSISYSATAGTVQLVSQGGGVARLLYTAPNVAGTYTVNVTSGINNATATVTVIASGTDPIVIQNAEPLNVEPAGIILIDTNYNRNEVTFSATAGFFDTSPQQKHWYHAPTQAGPVTITVTHPTGGTDTIVANVYLRVTPKNPAAVGFGAQIQFAANYPTITWIATTGTVNASGLWTAGTTPGTFAVQAQATIAGNLKIDNATVSVFGDALALNVPSAVTLPPGGTLTITSNYPTSELTFSATCGTFGAAPNQNVYTAPTNAGQCTITVIRGSQSANVVVTVSVAIAPAAVSMAQSTTQIFTCNADVTIWNATGGVLSDYVGFRQVTYTAGTTPGNYQITANTALGNAIGTITNTGTASVPIVIAGAALVFLEPGGTYNVTTNKPIGTYSLTATGGSFEGNVYRAPQNSGSYIITATDTSGTGGGSDTLEVRVPLRITPSNPTVLPGANQQFQLNYPAESTTWTTSPATLITATGLWTAPFTVGVYTIRAFASPSGEATTQATVATVELVVYGPDHITLEPGASYQVSTNLPPRASSYTAFGGTFELYTYIAPEAAGAYYFTVSYGGQTVRIDVTVPLRIAPKEVRVQAGESVQFTINAPSASWSVLGRGTVSQTGFYTAPASGGLVDKVTATTSLGSDTATVLLVDEFPFDPSYALVSNLGRRVVLVEAEDGTPFGRGKGPVRGHWEFIFENRDAEEYQAARAFFNARFPDIPVLIHDADLDEFIGVYFDSELHRESINVCEINYSFRGREVYSIGSEST